MSKPFDSTLNDLLDARPDEWVAFLGARAGIPPGPAVAIDTDLSTTIQADKLFRIDGVSPAILHIELEASSRLGVAVRMLRYNAVTHHNVGLPVNSVLVLLRPKAQASDQTGRLVLNASDGEPYLTFRHTIIRVWEESMETFLSAGPGLAPLAFVTNEAAVNPSDAFGRLRQRLRTEGVSVNLMERLLTATLILGSLRYDFDLLQEIDMALADIWEESSIYQGGKAEGMTQAGQNLLRLQGRKRFGAPKPEQESQLQSIADIGRLERMGERMLDAVSWDDLLATA